MYLRIQGIHRMLKLVLMCELKTESLAFLMGIIEIHESVYSEETLSHTSNPMCFIKSVCSKGLSLSYKEN